jgi:hypothetical protein
VIQKWTDIFRAEAVATGQVASVEIGIFPGSAILRAVFKGTSGELHETVRQQLFDSLSKEKLRAYTAAHDDAKVEAVSWSFPQWSDWRDMDDPTTLDGDEELIAPGESVCADGEPLYVLCTTVDNVSWAHTNETLDVPCSLAQGGVVLRCLNSQNPKRGCSDYRIRFLCGGKMTAQPTAQPTALPTANPTADPTLQPVISAGVSEPCTCSAGCSGHGSCQRSETGCRCECSPGWYKGDCSSFVLEVSINGTTNECEGAVSAPNSALVPAIQELSCSEQRSGWMSQRSTLKVGVKYDYKLQGPVQCKLTSSNNAEATLKYKENETLLFMPTGAGPKYVRLQGVADAVDDGDKPFTVSVHCSGQDRTVHTARISASSTNVNVKFPIIRSIFPTIIPRIGAQVTVRGDNFGSGDFDLRVGGVQVGPLGRVGF